MGSVTIVALPEGADGLTEAARARLGTAGTVVVATADGSSASALRDAGVGFVSLAELGLSPEAPAARLVSELLARAETSDVVFAVSGYPLMRAGVVSGLLARSPEGVAVLSSETSLQVLLMAFDIDLTADLDIVDVRSLRDALLQRDSHLIVTGVSNPVHARSAAERLASVYPPEHRVVAALCPEGAGFYLTMPTVAALADVDVCDDTAFYVPPAPITPPSGFEEFVRIIGVLRGPDGCPWDRAQDHMSLRKNMIEEAYEAVAAIESGDPQEVSDELGDVLLQIVLHAQIASESKDFTIDDVIDAITAKIRRRHPHIFGGAPSGTPDEVLHRWDRLKSAERGGDGVLDGVPPTFPALMYAQKISRRAVSVGFEWESLEDVWEKFNEEVDELRAAEPGSPEAADEIGDVLFTVVNLARKQGIDAETALRTTCERFKSRFEDMERQAAAAGTPIEEMGLEQMERLWQTAKSREKPGKDLS